MFFQLFFLNFIAILYAQSPREQFLRWSQQLEPTDHPEANYRFSSELYIDIATIIQSNGYTVEPVRIGKTFENRTIWGFSIKPTKSKHCSVFILGGVHPLEWLGGESTTTLLQTLAEHPPEHTEVIIVPLLNMDRRLLVEHELRSGERKYRRSNSGGEDLNRDYEIHRDATAIWRHLFPERYTTSSAPLSQPESQAIDALFQHHSFDAAVSIHAFGGYIYYPWAGRYAKTENWKELHQIATRMKQAQPGLHPYHVKQLSHWMFLFRAQGTELDHFYGKYGSNAFLIESTRSGIQWWKPADWKDPFRLYNPRDPTLDIQRTVASMHALIRYYDTLPIDSTGSNSCLSKE